jgi:hypothetical protein
MSQMMSIVPCVGPHVYLLMSNWIEACATVRKNIRFLHCLNLKDIFSESFATAMLRTNNSFWKKGLFDDYLKGKKDSLEDKKGST